MESESSVAVFDRGYVVPPKSAVQPNWELHLGPRRVSSLHRRGTLIPGHDEERSCGSEALTSTSGTLLSTEKLARG